MSLFVKGTGALRIIDSNGVCKVHHIAIHEPYEPDGLRLREKFAVNKFIYLFLHATDGNAIYALQKIPMFITNILRPNHSVE